MENNSNFSPQESLALIESMIHKAKNSFSENGTLYLLWGWTVFFCSVGHFVCAWQQWLVHPESVWALTWAAVIYQLVFLSKRKKGEKVKTYASEINGYVWIAFFIMMVLTSFLMSKSDTFERMYPMYLVLYGMPTFLSGVILRFKSLKIGGIICWCLAFAAAYIPLEYQLLLIAAAVVLAWIIPGYLLRAKFKSEKA
jgi:hypothetical protein